MTTTPGGVNNTEIKDIGLIPMGGGGQEPLQGVGHITFQISFVALVVRSRLVSIGRDVEEAARDLFASTPYLLRRVTIPLLLPGIVAGAMLAFIISIDDFIITLMVAQAGSTTLPLYIYGMVRMGITPEINAVSTIMLAVSILFVSLSYYIGQRR